VEPTAGPPGLVPPAPVLPVPVPAGVVDPADAGRVATFGYPLMTREFPSDPGPGATQLSRSDWSSPTAITRWRIPIAASWRFAPAIPDLRLIVTATDPSW
jgi:hypothetical protein